LRLRPFRGLERFSRQNKMKEKLVQNLSSATICFVKQDWLLPRNFWKSRDSLGGMGNHPSFYAPGKAAVQVGLHFLMPERA